MRWYVSKRMPQAPINSSPTPHRRWDEILQRVGETRNSQNSLAYVNLRKKFEIPQKHCTECQRHTGHVMISTVVSKFDKIPIYFVKPSVKRIISITAVTLPVLRYMIPKMHKISKNQHFISARWCKHTTKDIIKYLTVHVPETIIPEEPSPSNHDYAFFNLAYCRKNCLSKMYQRCWPFKERNCARMEKYQSRKDRQMHQSV